MEDIAEDQIEPEQDQADPKIPVKFGAKFIPLDRKVRREVVEKPGGIVVNLSDLLRGKTTGIEGIEKRIKPDDRQQSAEEIQR